MVTAACARRVLVEQVMGTVLSLDARVTGQRDVEASFAGAMRWLRDVDRRFSTYRPDSEINRIDRGELALHAASADVRSVLSRCAELRRETHGAFHERAGGSLDPSALVKGWAAQRVADRLHAGGLDDFCLTVGGDVAVRGGARPSPTWRVGIQHPLDRGAIAAAIEVSDVAVATSGAYERGGHVLDPRTGEPASGVLSVTVVGPDLGTADAYSTAAFALGADGPAWTSRLAGYDAMTILSSGAVLSTPGFPEFEPA